MKKISGCYPALVTPIIASEPNIDGKINFPELEKLIKFVEDCGVEGIAVAGCTGHSASLTVEEQLGLLDFAMEKASPKTRIIFGDGSNCTREAIDFAKKAEDHGAKTHLSISPYQNKPNPEGMFLHYSKIASAIGGELIVYNVPGRTGKNIEAETTLRLAKEHSNIIGIKEASGNIAQIKKIIDATEGSEFSVLSGDDALTLEIMRLGGTGVISTSANLIAKEMSEMVRHCLAGEFENAEKIDARLQPVYKAMFFDTNPMPMHYALKSIGIDAGIPRLPLCEIDSLTKEKINSVLDNFRLSR
ncbi:MAG: 4-hydroxy-tetrahydrodipicolinate synthase [Candidatus Diapherotrites archaeon]|nr:4-hydroxy-tetrahydrodipicolinate synthase [Candidatus Diapherotrites archaeon]